MSDNCEYLVSIAVDHSGQTDYGFVACTVPSGSSDRKVAVIDLSSSPSSFSPVTSIYANTIGGTDLV
ncbi:MAG: hypothetical protein GXP62_10565, partial [Oligoflexia bacterium]|nr:hypothetical protein [Oligoflexia bacterium]